MGYKVLKKIKTSIKSVAKKEKKTSRRDVQKFIRYELKSRLTRDLRKLRITNEAELQTLTYFHLRRFVKPDKRWGIRVQPYISKKWGIRKTISYFPDIVLEIRKPRIALELKEKRSLRKETIRKDARKLYRMKKQQLIRKGFVLYLYRKKTEDKESSIQREVSSWLPPKYRNHVYCVVINAYNHIPKNNWEEWDKRWKRVSQRKI